MTEDEIKAIAPVLWKRPDGQIEALTDIDPRCISPDGQSVMGAYLVACPEATARKIQRKLATVKDGQHRHSLIERFRGRSEN